PWKPPIKEISIAFMNFRIAIFPNSKRDISIWGKPDISIWDLHAIFVRSGFTLMISILHCWNDDARALFIKLA
ncbi:hypothetical protein, partial [Noviherbaspirillum malthae]|uniref:hypothetical protein n=1 Tax=Noviherbaspirillum malthae TaxID=1260987 RepID=UPI001E612920